MNALLPIAAIDQPGEEVLAWLNQELSAQGFRAVQTFDLQVARGAHDDCSCPHHGTDKCDCQMVVLLVYGRDYEPDTLVLHGQDGRTWLSLADTAGERGNRHLEAALRRAVAPHLAIVPAHVEVSSED